MQPPAGTSDVTSDAAEVARLRDEVDRLRHINCVLADRVESSLTGQSAAGLFQQNVALEALVARRTRELDETNRQLRRQVADNEQTHAQLTLIARHAPCVPYQFLRRHDGTTCFPFGGERLATLLQCRFDGVETDGSPVFERVLEEDLPGLIESTVISASAMSEWRYHFRMRRADGETRWIYGISTPKPHPEGIVWHGILTDVTEQRHAEQHTALLANVVERTDNIVLLTDTAHRIRWVNAAFTRTTGYTLDEATGQHPMHLLGGFNANALREGELESELLAGRTVEVELEFRKKSGEAFWGALEIQPVVDDDGQMIHCIALLRDVTRQKKIEAERQQMLDAARSARRLAEERSQAMAVLREKAEAASAAKTQFLANVSHEIRTPMNGILGFAELLEDDDLTPAHRQDFLATIRRNGQHLLTIINDVLDLSKIEAGRMETERVALALRPLIEDVLDLQRTARRSSVVDLELVYDPSLPMMVQSDPVRIRQVLTNLVGNAMKFTEHGKVEVLVQPAAGAENRIAITVADTGIGMTPEQMDRLFQPFQQADTSTTRRFGGTGLGLTISRRLAQALGGDIAVQSKLGVGSRFTFTFDPGEVPESAQTMHQVTQPSGVIPEPVPSELHGSILLAEDGVTNQRLIQLFLQRAGLSIDIACNGQEAVARAVEARSAGKPYDLVLMDMQMPVMDGYAATRALRRQGFTCPIIALTAHAMSGDREKCLSVGCTDYTPKPIDRATLLHLVRTHLAGVGTPASAHS